MPKSSPTKSAGFRNRQALIAAANAGDMDAQSRLGDVYREGDKWTAQDCAEAVRWYRAAATERRQSRTTLARSIDRLGRAKGPRDRGQLVSPRGRARPGHPAIQSSWH